VKVPFNDLAAATQQDRDQLLDCMRRVVDSGWFVLGPEVSAFESEFASYCGPGLHAVGVANGSDALELSLRAAGVLAGDRVACCANASMYASLAICHVGAVPVFVDIGADHTMDPAAFAAIASDKIKAAIVTHLYGQLADMTNLLATARAFGIKVIEDCAQAHGARIAGQRAGSFGDFASFSFYPTKNLGALGDGGAVVCQNLQGAETVRSLRQYGWAQKYQVTQAGGRNSRLDALQAAILRLRLAKLDANNAARHAIASRYVAEINHPDIVLPMIGPGHVAHLFVIRTQRRTDLIQYLTSMQIGHDVHYPIADHQQATMADRYPGIQLPRTEQFASEVLSLPCFPELAPAQVQRVIQVLNAWPK
jgi:dTDP-3-amino-2,3,6-trideoxy-4-keto-D-glucose/dTDP-3-amino-3,4,6-trideoxy-alpha-D-glucose/dTDP-2,6-dideoxy-D-kanosamine transaminase